MENLFGVKSEAVNFVKYIFFVGNIESVSKLHCKYLCLEIVLEEGEGKGRVEVNYDGQVLRVNATSGKRFYISNFIFS